MENHSFCLEHWPTFRVVQRVTGEAISKVANGLANLWLCLHNTTSTLYMSMVLAVPLQQKGSAAGDTILGSESIFGKFKKEVILIYVNRFFLLTSTQQI